MSIINYYNSPTVINWNLDDDGKKVSIPISNESKQVVDGKIPLEELPDEQYRIKITGYVEINIKDKIDSTDKFKCDYTHGVLYFDQSMEGRAINIDRYYGRGQFLLPASRVWTKLGLAGEVVQTLDTAIESVVEAEEVSIKLQKATNKGDILKRGIDSSISTGRQVSSELTDKVSIAKNQRDDLNSGVLNADSSIGKLDLSIRQGDQSKLNLDSTVSEATIIDSKLSDNVLKGSGLKSDLDVNIKTGNELQLTLPPIIQEAKSSKSNLNNSIDSSTIKKQELDNSVSLATKNKSSLDTSVENANTIDRKSVV